MIDLYWLLYTLTIFDGKFSMKKKLLKCINLLAEGGGAVTATSNRLYRFQLKLIDIKLTSLFSSIRLEWKKQQQQQNNQEL